MVPYADQDPKRSFQNKKFWAIVDYGQFDRKGNKFISLNPDKNKGCIEAVAGSIFKDKLSTFR